MENILNAWKTRFLSVMRMVTAFLFMQHGGQKLFGYPAAQRYEFDILSLSGVAGVLELFGGFLVFIGFVTRPTAFVLSGLMAFAYFIAHAPRGFWPILNGGELAIMFCFVFLYLSVAGGGEWSVDHIISVKRRENSA